MGIGFAGGLASGLQAGFETAGRQRERGLQALKFTAEQRKELRDRLSTQLDTLVATIGSGIKDGKFTFDSLPQGIGAATEMMFDSFGRALGPDEEARARTTFQARIQGFSTPTETARTQARAEVTAAETQAELVGLEGEAGREAVAAKLGFGPADDVFFRALDAFQELNQDVQAGLRSPDDPRLDFVRRRIESLVAERGFQISIDPATGRVVVQQGAVSPATPLAEATPFAGLGASEQVQLSRQAQSLSSNIRLIDRLVLRANEIFGPVGTARRLAQTAGGVAESLAGALPGDIGDAIVQTAKDIGGFLSTQDLDELQENFDPDLSKIQLIENTIAFELARLRVTRSGDDIRALTAAFKDAKADVDLQGLRSPPDVAERLLEIRSQFAEELTRLGGALGTDFEIAAPPAFRVTEPEQPDETLSDRVKSILGID